MTHRDRDLGVDSHESPRMDGTDHCYTHGGPKVLTLS